MSDSPPVTDWIPIASFLPSHSDAVVIEETLRAAKIPFLTEGSRATQILVAPHDAPRAIEALKNCPVASRMHFYPAG